MGEEAKPLKTCGFLLNRALRDWKVWAIFEHPTGLVPEMVKRVYLAVSARTSMISIVMFVSGGVFLKGNGSKNRLKL